MKSKLLLLLSSISLASCSFAFTPASEDLSSFAVTSEISEDSSNENGNESGEIGSIEDPSSEENEGDSGNSNGEESLDSQGNSEEESSEESQDSAETGEDSSIEDSSSEDSGEDSSNEDSSEESEGDSSEDSSSSSEEIAPSNWDPVSDINPLFEGDIIKFGSIAHKAVAGAFNSTGSSAYLAYNMTSFDGDALVGNKIGKEFIVHVNSDGTYGFESDGKLLGATKEKKLAFDAGTTKWNVSFSDVTATVTNATSNYGSLRFNQAAPRFTTYTTTNSTSDIEIYRGEVGEKIYANDIVLSAPSTLDVGSTAQLGVSFLPENTNMRRLSFVSSAPEIASISNSGVISGLSEGTARIGVTAYSGEDAFDLVRYIDVDVVPVAVTGIRLSQTSKTISLGSTFQLNATISPSNATNKEIIYQSEDPTIATVSDTGLIRANMVGNTAITATSVDGGFAARCEVEVSEEVLDAWTILLYMCGSDLESSYTSGKGYATLDIKEILSVANQPDDVNIVIETGGASKWSSGYGSASSLSRYHVENKSMVLDETVAKASMGKASTLQSFLTYGLSNYPAEKTALILWNHGGALDGVCFDENFNYDSLTANEVQSALRGCFDAVGRTEKLEFIGYDACLMAVQDIAAINSEFFNYMVAAEEAEAGEGWAYNAWLDDVFDYAPTEDILSEICDSFVDTYEQTYGRYYGNNQTLAAYDLSKMENYVTAFEEMAEEISPTVKSNRSSFKALIKKAKDYGDSDMAQGYYYYGSFDAVDALTRLNENSTFANAKIPAAIAAIQETVIANAAGKNAGNSNGIALIVPLSNYVAYSASEITTPFTSWQAMVNSL